MSKPTDSTRRAALGALARVSALAFLPAGAAIARTADIPAADAKLVELDRRHAEVAEAARKAQDPFRAAEASLRQAVGFEPRKAIDYGRSDRSISRQLRAHEAAVAVFQASKAQAETELRVAELGDAYLDARSALSLIEGDVWATPAVGLAGLCAKARIAARGNSVAYSIIQDLIAMEGAGG